MHWEATKWLFKYIKGTTNVGLVYKRREETKLRLEGFVDADYARNKDNRRSTTAYMLCLNGCCIRWKAQLQPIVALSTIGAKYIAATEAIKEALWLQGILQELKQLFSQTVRVPFTYAKTQHSTKGLSMLMSDTTLS